MLQLGRELVQEHELGRVMHSAKCFACGMGTNVGHWFHSLELLC